MAALDHQIVLARDKAGSARFLTELLDLPAPEPQSIFLSVTLDNVVTLLFKQVSHDFPGHHYAFRVDGAAFRRIHGRVRERGIRFWATPRGDGVGKLYELDGETGFYLHDPSGHQLEVLTEIQPG